MQDVMRVTNPGIGRPRWIPASQWLAIVERAQELKEAREAAQRYRYQEAVQDARLDPDTLDWDWLQDNPNRHPGRKPCPPRRATCRICGYHWVSKSSYPKCSRCHCRYIDVEPQPHQAAAAAAA